MHKQQHIYNLPNLVSSIRILIAPLLFYFAFNKLENWFLVALFFSAATDVLDGYLARKLQQITRLGSQLDSWGDFTIYSTMAVCAWIIWPEIVQREILYFSMILFSFLLPVGIGLIKFGSLTSYHTWSVKLAVFVTFIGYITLFSGLADWPFVLASYLCVYAGIEEIVITLASSRERVDVRSIWAALRYERGLEEQSRR
jgi:CDP-diacylglycerol--glycerol-3-phosphate 3-phosphatidyltransferase